MKKTIIIVALASIFTFHFSASFAQTTELTNLVVFLRFADDEEIDHSFADIDSMFNGRTPGYLSVYNFYDALGPAYLADYQAHTHIHTHTKTETQLSTEGQA